MARDALLVVRRWLSRFGHCETCERWRWDLEIGEVVTDYPAEHSSGWIYQCQSCWEVVACR